MGLWGRVFGRRRSGGPADEALPFMSIDEAAELRSAMARAFAERGVEVAVHPGHVSDDSGRQFGLWNVAASCHQDPAGRSAWPKVVDAHVARVLDSMTLNDPFAELSPQQIRQQAYLRLYDPSTLPGLEEDAQRTWAPGIVELLALDLPHAVVSFNAEHIDEFGGWEILHAQALANLEALPVEESRRVAVEGGGTFRLLEGESMFTASRALTLPTLGVELGDAPPTARGWLLAVPHRHLLLWHTVESLDVVNVVGAMARLAADQYADSPGSISPHLYWWDGTGYQQLTHVAEDGTASIVVSPELQHVLEELAEGIGGDE